MNSIGANRSQVQGATIHSVPALHFSARGLTDRNETLWCGYMIEIEERAGVLCRRHGVWETFRVDPRTVRIAQAGVVANRRV